jgi:putative ABC transport system permease protein
VLVGDLVATRLRVDPRRLAPGERVWFEGAHWPISGVFRAPGTTIAGEIWAPLTALQGAVRRDDVSVLFVRFADADAFTDLEVFARRRLDLELVAVPTQRFFAEAAAWFGPIQTLAWALAAMIAAATLFAAVNTFGTAVRERSKELATLRALGFPGRALVVALCIEAFLLAAAGALVGLLLARLAVSGAAFRIAMNAFALDVDGLAVLIGALGAVATGLLATLPAARRILTTPIAAGLKGA